MGGKSFSSSSFTSFEHENSSCPLVISPIKISPIFRIELMIRVSPNQISRVTQDNLRTVNNNLEIRTVNPNMGITMGINMVMIMMGMLNLVGRWEMV
jgi:hypothetical protein